jgi:predicted GNAT family N-acyltransferase
MKLDPPAGSLPAHALRASQSADETAELTFEFTRDPVLLRQYHAIYEREFRAVHNAPYQHVEDEHDRRAHILVARRGEICVGGARLSAKTPRKPELLPIEIDGFRIEDHFPYLGQKSYGQLGRVCLLPELRDGTATRVMFWYIQRKAVALGLAELFGTATLVGTRTYKRHCRALGLDASIYRDIELPTYPMCEELKFYLIKSVLDKPPLPSPAGLSGHPSLREQA